MADDASITLTVFEHPSVQAARLRAKCEKAVDRLLAMLDALGPDPDDEPSLGFSEVQNWHYSNSLDQRQIAQGATDDREGEHDGLEPPEDVEETLGRSENIDQRRMEFGQDDREPSLGAANACPWVDQLQWGNRTGSFVDDAEDQCEDEGAEHDGREPEGYS